MHAMGYDSDPELLRRPPLRLLTFQEAASVTMTLAAAIKVGAAKSGAETVSDMLEVFAEVGLAPHHDAFADWESLGEEGMLRMLLAGKDLPQLLYGLDRIVRGDGKSPPPNVLKKLSNGLISLHLGPNHKFRPVATVIPTWAVVACVSSALQTMMTPMNPVSWVLLCAVVSSTMMASRQQLSPVQAQIVAELYISTNSARVPQFPKRYLFGNVNRSREGAGQRELSHFEFDEALKELEDRGLIARGAVTDQGESVGWGMVTI